MVQTIEARIVFAATIKCPHCTEENLIQIGEFLNYGTFECVKCHKSARIDLCNYRPKEEDIGQTKRFLCEYRPSS